MTFSSLLTDLWLVGRRKFQPRVIFKSKRPKVSGNNRVTIKIPPPQSPREQKIDRLLNQLKHAHEQADAGKISPTQLAELRSKIDEEIQNA